MNNKDELNELNKIVNQLILTKREDEWWDFKREHHHDKADLVHDILCMANNRPRRDSYIIFGVDDDHSVAGIEKDNIRRNQQEITDILRNVKFAGSVRPRIEVKTTIIDNHEIDVLIVKDSVDVPYYLEVEYQDSSKKNDKGKKYGRVVKAYHVYTRVADNNTPIDKQADINDLEFLWRKRLGIDLPIKDRLQILLSEYKKWCPDWGNRTSCYHSDYPEFQIIKIEDMKEGWEPSAAFYTNPKMHYAKLLIIYHNTTILDTELLAFDEFRRYLPRPKRCYLGNEKKYTYDYYQLDATEGKLLKIFTNGNCDITSREQNYNQFLIFNNEDEKKEFDSFLLEHIEDHSESEVKVKYKQQIDNERKANRGGQYYSALSVAQIAWLYEDWKNQV